MVRPIMKDPIFLSQKSEPATQEDVQVVKDLLETLKAYEDSCVGLAANMIGVNKRIIAINVGMINVAMINPVITKRTDAYETEESCLSLSGVRGTTRYQEIEVEYLDARWQKHTRSYSGWTAQIIQHECDHLEGILI